MIFKLLLFGLWGIVVVQAFPSEPVTVTAHTSEEKEKACDKKLLWYRETTQRTQELFDKYYGEYKRFKKANNPNEDHLEAEHNEFEQKVTEALNRYQDDAKKIYNISDDSTRLAFCTKEINWFRVLDQNLTKTATNIKSDVLSVLDALGVPKEVRDNLDKVLSRIVNFLFIIDMTKNIYKDVNSLVRDCFSKTDEGIKLEEKYRFGENGELVETAQEIDEEYKEALEDNEVDKKLQEDLNELKDDTKIRAAEDKAVEREEERVEETEKERNGAGEEGARGEPVEEPYKFEFTPVVLRA